MAEPAGGAALDHAAAAQGRDEDVAGSALEGMAQAAVVDQGMGELEHLVCHWAPFGAVAVQQRVGGPAGGDQGELPAQVVRVGDTGVHALATGWGVDVHGVAGQQHAAAAVSAG